MVVKYIIQFVFWPSFSPLDYFSVKFDSQLFRQPVWLVESKQDNVYVNIKNEVRREHLSEITIK